MATILAALFGALTGVTVFNAVTQSSLLAAANAGFCFAMMLANLIECAKAKPQETEEANTGHLITPNTGTKD